MSEKMLVPVKAIEAIVQLINRMDGSANCIVVRNRFENAGCITRTRFADLDSYIVVPPCTPGCTGCQDCRDQVGRAINYPCTDRASFDDHKVCIGCGELTTCDEDYLCCRCDG